MLLDSPRAYQIGCATFAWKRRAGGNFSAVAPTVRREANAKAKVTSRSDLAQVSRCSGRSFMIEGTKQADSSKKAGQPSA